MDEVTFLGHEAIIQLRLAGTGLAVAARVLGDPVPGPGTEVRVSVRGPVRAYAVA